MRRHIVAVAACIFILFPFCAQGASTLEKLTVEVAASVGKSVVSISSVVKEKTGGRFYFGSPFDRFEDDPFERFFEEFFGALPEREFKRRGLGSGVIIDPSGYILTNNHVVSGASEVKVKLFDGREFDAQIKGTDPRSDLAVIKIEAQDLPAAKLGNSDELKIGNWVLAIGNPFGFAIENPEPTITVGVISALGRDLPALGRRQRGHYDLIQTDAAINPGNSGGPLVNLKGEVIGINTAIITTSGGYQGLGFAIPVNQAKKILDKLLRGEKILYGWLGVNIQDLNEDLRSYFGVKAREGVIVLKVYKDSPAEKGGLKEGDLILAFNKKSIKTTRDLVRLVSSSEVGEFAPLKIIRAGKTHSLNIKIGKMPEDLKVAEETEEEGVTFRGMVVDNMNSIYQRKFRIRSDEGAVVVDVKPGSLAEKSGLAVGDVIFKVESKKIKNVEDFKAAVSKVKNKCLLKTGRGYLVLKGED